MSKRYLAVDSSDPTLIRHLEPTETQTYQDTGRTATQTHTVAVVSVSADQPQDKAEEIARIFSASPEMLDVLEGLDEVFDFARGFDSQSLGNLPNQKLNDLFRRAVQVTREARG